MTTEHSFQVAIVGCGGRGRAHVPGLLADPRLSVVALVDPKREQVEAVAEEYGLNATFHAEVETMLEIVRPDIVISALWTNLHLPVFRACVEAGVRAVLSEKPMAATWGDCLKMAELAERSGVQLTFCHQRRFASGNRMVRKLLEAGQFGTIERMDLFSPPHLLDCGTHTVDQALSFNRETPVSWVHGAVDLSTTVEFFGIPAEGRATGMLAFGNGVAATFQCGRDSMDLWGGVRVVGSEGFIEVFWDGGIRRAKVYADPSWMPPQIIEDPLDQMVSYIRNAIDGLCGGPEPETSHRYALRATEPLFAFYESARLRERISLPLKGVEGSPLTQMLEERKGSSVR